MSWFEEPVSSDDLDGLRLLRDRAPGRDGDRRRRVRLRARLLPADARRRRGRRAAGRRHPLRRDHRPPRASAALCEAHQIPLSAHCAPQLHAHACCAIGPLRHLEYFHDHARIEQMLFDGALEPADGALRPDPTVPASASSSRPATPRASRHEAADPCRARPSRPVRNLRRGRAQRLLSGATAAAALPLGAEIYVNHYGGSFGNKWMWTPVVLSPALGAAGVAGVVSERAARTWLPALLGAVRGQRRARASTCTCAASRASPAGCARPPTTSSWARRCWRPAR